MVKEKFKETTKFVGTEQSIDISGDVLITDPCYLTHGVESDIHEDWGTIVRNFGLTPYMEHSTLYGDWGCTVFRTTEKNTRPAKSRAIGNFCADAGLVCVCRYSDICEKNAGFDAWARKHPWCACVIRGFDGTVSFDIFENTFMFEGEICKEKELRVTGSGKVNGRPFRFMSYQTSL